MGHSIIVGGNGLMDREFISREDEIIELDPRDSEVAIALESVNMKENSFALRSLVSGARYFFRSEDKNVQQNLDR